MTNALIRGCSCCKRQDERDCAQFANAEALMQAGYGDVSEYKAEVAQHKVQDKVINGNFDILEVLNNTIKERDAEIERLKAEYKQLETNAEILARGVRDLNHENYELTEKVKQAQIDALNADIEVTYSTQRKED